MIGLVVATHGALGEALLTTAGLIVGQATQACTVSLSQGNSAEELRELLARKIAEVDQGDGVLVMVDMFGGTPANIGMTLLAPGRVELLTGVNLPMLLKFFTYRERYRLPELAEFLMGRAREGIVLASEALNRQP
jgi:PTS system mannose-specific IIA component